MRGGAHFLPLESGLGCDFFESSSAVDLMLCDFQGWAIPGLGHCVSKPRQYWAPRNQEEAMQSPTKPSSPHTIKLPAGIVSACYRYPLQMPKPGEASRCLQSKLAGWKSHPIHSAQLAELCVTVNRFCCFKGCYILAWFVA